MSLDELKKTVRDKCDMAHALAALNFSVGSREREIFRRTSALLGNGTRAQLEQAEFILDVNIQTAEKFAGYKGGDEFILALGRGHRERKFEVMQYTKFAIDKLLFKNFEKVIPTWKKLQPHILIRFDLDGEDRDFYLPEASLYEDMCFAFNEGWRLRKEQWIVGNQDSKARIKALVFYTRTAIISAYNFVESYFNGLAFDFLATARRTVSQQDRDMLTEWDSTRNRQKFVKFRDKAIQYPKTILNRKTPLFTESSCLSLATLLENVNYRDAVVHNSPKLNVAGDEMPKIKDLIGLRFSTATKIVDAAVDLVLEVDKAVNQGRYDNSWLLPRTGEGPLPPSSFA